MSMMEFSSIYIIKRNQQATEYGTKGGVIASEMEKQVTEGHRTC